MDREIVSYKRVVQNNKQLLSMMGRKAKETRLKRISAGRLTNPYDKSLSATASTPPASTTASSTASLAENASKGEEKKSEEGTSPSAEPTANNDTTTDSQGGEES